MMIGTAAVAVGSGVGMVRQALNSKSGNMKEKYFI